MKKTLVSLALATSLLSGCTMHFGSGDLPNRTQKQSSAEVRSHTTSEKVWFVWMAACHFADYYTTKRGLDKGLEEKNPLFGKHPSDKKLMLGKLVSLGIFYTLGRAYPKDRELIYKVGSGINCGAAVWNTYQTRNHEN